VERNDAARGSCREWVRRYGRRAALVAIGGFAIGLKSDREKLAILRSGRAPFRERGLDQAISTGLASGRLRFTSDPTRPWSYLTSSFSASGHHPGRVVGLGRRGGRRGRSGNRGRQSRRPRTRDEEHGHRSGVRAGLRRCSKRSTVRCRSFPIRSSSGRAQPSRFLHPDRTVLGSDDPRALETVVEVYRPVLEQVLGADPRRQPPLVRTNRVTTETVKYAANAFLATKVSFINEAANICELVGAGISEVATALGLGSRIGPHSCSRDRMGEGRALGGTSPLSSQLPKSAVTTLRCSGRR